jgi:hypothetical protein
MEVSCYVKVIFGWIAIIPREKNMRPRGNEFGIFPKKIHGVYIFGFMEQTERGHFGQQEKGTVMKQFNFAEPYK